MEKILAKGINTETKEYDIPDNLFLSKDIIQTQLKILESTFPQIKIQSDKNDNKIQEDSNKQQESKTEQNITSISTNSQVKYQNYV